MDGKARLILMSVLLFFLLFGQGYAQETEYYFMIDTSGSMEGKGGQGARNILADLKLTLTDYVKDEIPLNSRLHIITFDKGIQSKKALSLKQKSDMNDVRRGFLNIRANGQETYIYRSLNEIINEARKSQYKQIKILLFTDGLDTDPKGPRLQDMLDNFKALTRDKRHAYLYIYTLGSVAFPPADVKELKGTKNVSVTKPPEGPIEKPKADFVAERLSGKATLETAFQDKSQGIVTHREWDFGDGQGSQDENPLHLYTKPGLYSVKLRVKGLGGHDEIVKKDYIKVASPSWWDKYPWLAFAILAILLAAIVFIIVCRMRPRFAPGVYILGLSSQESFYLWKKQGFCGGSVTFGGSGADFVSVDLMDKPPQLFFTPLGGGSQKVKLMDSEIQVDGKSYEKGSEMPIYTGSSFTIAGYQYQLNS
jgi:PKD repeat protein